MMKTKFLSKVNFLAYLNLSLGFMAFSTGFIPLLIFISTISSVLTNSYFWDTYFFISIFGFYYGLMMDYPLIFFVSCCVSALFGIFTFPIGLLSSIYIKDKLLRGIGFIGNTLGTLGLIGNLISLLLTLIPKS